MSLDPSQRALLNRLAQQIVRHRMTVPAVFTLESFKPLNNVGAQLLVFFMPLAQTLFDRALLAQLASILENRDGIEELILAIEAAEDQYNPPAAPGPSTPGSESP